MTELGDAQNENENINEEGYFYVLNKEREKDQKKKKKKKKKEILDHEDENEIQKARKKDKRINGDGEGRELLQGLKEAQMIREENMNLKMIGSKDLRNNSELGMKREKKKKHKEEKRAVSSRKEVLEDNKTKVAVEGKIYSEKRENDERKHRKEDLKTEKKRKREMEGVDVLAKNNMVGGEVEMERELSDGKNVEKARPVKKKRRKEKENRNGDVGAGLLETILTKTSDKEKGVEVDQSVGNESNALSSSNETGERTLHANSTKDHNKDVKQKKKKKKVESDKHVSERNHDKGVPRTRNDVEATYENSTPGGTSKRVSFSDHVEVFTPSDDPIEGKSDQDGSFVRGKRFSEEEDEILKKAVFNYIEAHDLGDEGLNMVLHCKSNPEVRNCWKEIRAALPWRPSDSIYYRAHILFERGEKRNWTQEEYEFIRNHHEKHGSEWKMMADAIGKHRFHVKDTWRRIKLSNRKKGRWSQDEYQKLFDLVNMDLRMRVFEEKKSKHGMLRDNISWEAISQKLSTRPNFLCCQKWYSQLSSPMVAEGIWADTDDYRLVDALYSLDACCIEDVDWDNLLEHRSGDVCRRRWDQMLKHIGEHANKSYAEQVEVLSKRYCTDVLEAREAYDSKPAVS